MWSHVSSSACFTVHAAKTSSVKQALDRPDGEPLIIKYFFPVCHRVIAYSIFKVQGNFPRSFLFFLLPLQPAHRAACTAPYHYTRCDARFANFIFRFILH